MVLSGSCSAEPQDPCKPHHTQPHWPFPRTRGAKTAFPKPQEICTLNYSSADPGDTHMGVALKTFFTISEFLNYKISWFEWAE